MAASRRVNSPSQDCRGPLFSYPIYSTWKSATVFVQVENSKVIPRYFHAVAATRPPQQPGLDERWGHHGDRSGEMWNNPEYSRYRRLLDDFKLQYRIVRIIASVIAATAALELVGQAALFVLLSAFNGFKLPPM